MDRFAAHTHRQTDAKSDENSICDNPLRSLEEDNKKLKPLYSSVNIR